MKIKKVNSVINNTEFHLKLFAQFMAISEWLWLFFFDFFNTPTLSQDTNFYLIYCPLNSQTYNV